MRDRRRRDQRVGGRNDPAAGSCPAGEARGLDLSLLVGVQERQPSETFATAWPVRDSGSSSAASAVATSGFRRKIVSWWDRAKGVTVRRSGRNPM